MTHLTAFHFLAITFYSHDSPLVKLNQSAGHVGHVLYYTCNAPWLDRESEAHAD